MPTNQDIVDNIVVLDDSVQELLIEAGVTKDAADALIAAFQATKDRVDNELSEVDNTTDANKPLSLSIIEALLLKVNINTVSTVNGVSLLTGVPLVIERGAVSRRTLSYELRGTLRSPAAPLPVADDSVVIESIGEFIYVESTGEPDEDETCFTSVHPDTGVAIGQWLLEIPHPDYLNAADLFKDAILDEWMEDEEIRIAGYNN